MAGRWTCVFAAVWAGLAVPSPASAARVLFVSDSTSDASIPDVLRAEGHTVDALQGDFAVGNPALRDSLAGYNAVYWSATGDGAGGEHTDSAVFANLSAYVSAGGRVFVTGYDTLASPADPMLIAFIGATSSSDGGSPSGPIIDTANSLNTGYLDTRGVTPSGAYSDQDTAIGLLGDTVMVVPSSGGAVWTLRMLGTGQIAYVSAGASGSSLDPAWTDATGAYHAALLNFAASSEGPLPDAGPPRDGGYVIEGGVPDASLPDSGLPRIDGGITMDAGHSRRSRRSRGCCATAPGAPAEPFPTAAAVLLVLAVLGRRRARSARRPASLATGEISAHALTSG